MKNFILIISVQLILSLVGYSQKQPVINMTIPSPTFSAIALAHDGVDLWVSYYQGSPSLPGVLYKISETDGTVLDTLEVPSTYRINGMVFENENLWITNNRSPKNILYKIDTINGTIIDSIPLRSKDSYGLAFDGQNLWLNRSDNMFSYNDTTYKISLATGNVVDYFKPYGNATMPTGLTFDGKYLWSIDTTNDLIFKIDKNTYDPVDTLFAPAGKTTGMAFDGQSLWVMDDDNTHLIYKIDISDTYVNSIGNLENNLDKKINIFPNPSSGSFFIQKDDNLNTDIIINDSKGNIVKSFNFSSNKEKVDLKDLPPGIYFIKIKQESSYTIQKITIN